MPYLENIFPRSDLIRHEGDIPNPDWWGWCSWNYTCQDHVWGMDVILMLLDDRWRFPGSSFLQCVVAITWSPVAFSPPMVLFPGSVPQSDLSTTTIYDTVWELVSPVLRSLCGLGPREDVQYPMFPIRGACGPPLWCWGWVKWWHNSYSLHT